MPYYKGSWYSQLPFAGWLDPEDRPGSAAYQVGGKPIPDSQQGIALPTRGGLGKWYNVTPPGGNQPFPLQQTDLGPAKWTGRGVDISAAGAHQMGYTPKNFPTDASFKVEPIDLTGLGLAAGYGGGVPGDNTDVPTAPGPGSTRREQQGPKMPAASLMDMLSGKAPLEFSPRDVSGNQIGVGDSIAQNSNSLIGLGMGLLQPYRPGESPYANALQGFQAGSVADSRRGYQQAQLAHQKTQDARQASQDKQAQSNWEKQFARSDPANTVTEFQKAAKDLGLVPGSPEHAQFAKTFYQSKGEGDWQIVQAPHPIYPGETVPVWANKRTRETQPFVPGQAAPDSATAAQGPTQPGAAPPGGGIPPAPPGSDPKEWRKEQTKLRVQQQTAEENRKKQAGMIDPVTEDIDRAINQTKQYPGMIAGTFGNLMKNVPGSQAHDVGKLIDTVKANASLDKLQQMRAQSPTGASGLGAVTQGEHTLLQNSIGALDQSQTPQQFLINLDRVKRIRHEIIHGPGTAPPPQFDLPESQRPKAASSAPKPGFVKGGYVFKGGDPSDQSNWAPVR